MLLEEGPKTCLARRHAGRDLDRLATAALREIARKKRKLVERDLVTRVIEVDARERDR
jgi:hypothetical protein